MGIPAFFRWLSVKCPSIIVYASESAYAGSDLTTIDLNEPNVNGTEFDNLYVDMNAIIHPCTHPTNRPLPNTEDEMILAIYAYIDRLMAIVRPRKLLYLAVDGVAPRAKLNQQRGRRFRAGQEHVLKLEKIQEVRNKLNLHRDTSNLPAGINFDSNCITPGTEFMTRLAEHLRNYVASRLHMPGWPVKLRVILSDASVPGEGEHKIMDFIRKQRCQQNYNPNTRHCLYGADADLIMLGLISHEPHFTIIREEHVFEKPVICELCGRKGHEFNECSASQTDVEKTNTETTMVTPDATFFFIRINVLREYLDAQLVSGFHFRRDLERSIDDFVFICFFVGNDFLPNLPCLEIREKGIDKLTSFYCELINEFPDQYLVYEGNPNFKFLKLLVERLASVEQTLMLQKRDNERRFKQRRNIADNEVDTVRLGEHGFHQRYYVTKFGVQPENVRSFARKVAFHYTRGLCWVLLYYHSGCPAWDWYFPYHYAPFACDLATSKYLFEEFESDFKNPGEPFTPMQQLMAVYPPSSAELLPEPFRPLMNDPQSPLIEFYPENFDVDLNGKRFDYQAVILLPFIKEDKLVRYVRPIEAEQLTDAERNRNRRGEHLIFFKKSPTSPLPVLSPASSTLTTFSPLKGQIFGCVRSNPSITIKNPSLTALEFRDPDILPNRKRLLSRLLPKVRLPQPELKASLHNIDPRLPYRPTLGFNERARFTNNPPMQRMIRHSVARFHPYGNQPQPPPSSRMGFRPHYERRFY